MFESQKQYYWNENGLGLSFGPCTCTSVED